jgi:multiple sugar transport system substrate-binding protein
MRDVLMTRRTAIHSGLIGLAAAYGLSGCGGDDEPAGGGAEGGGAPTGEVTFGSNYSDEVPKQALQASLDAYEQQSGGVTVAVNTVEHETFQEQINNYLQGDPDDVFSWFAGYRMQFFAERGLATEIDDVWQEIGGEYSEAFKAQSKGLDGKYYFVPFYWYPWAVFYRKSVFEKNGYEPAANLDEFRALLDQIQSDGMTPLAFADKDGWPAMGTFDYLNMRTNGYDFHIALMRGEESWESPQVKEVFSTWAELLPYHQEGALGRTWQEAAQGFANGDAAMMVLGMFIGQQFPEKDRDDLDFFPFPEINPEFGQDSVEAPIDGFMLSKDPENEDAAKDLLTFLGRSQAQTVYLEADPNNIAASLEADTASYSPMQKKAAQLIADATNISQFLDRDTRPDFASTVMIPGLQQFIREPGDIDGLTKSLEQQKKAIFTS